MSKSWVITISWILFLLLGWTYGTAAYMPSPMEIIHAFPTLLGDGLAWHLWKSMALNFTAASLVFITSLAIAYSTTLPFPWGKIVRPLATIVSCGRFNGMVGLPLIFMSLLHNPHEVKIALLLFGTTVFSVMSLVSMIETIPRGQFDLARTLRMSEWRVVWEVVVLGRFDDVLSIMRVNFAMLWMLLPLVEGNFKFEGGVGTLMLIDEKHLQMDKLLCVLLVITMVGFIQDQAIRMFRSTLCPYADMGMERQ